MWINLQVIILAEILSLLGIEVIKVDLDDPVGCNEALKDAYGVFLVTNYAEILDANREIQQVREQNFFIVYSVNELQKVQRKSRRDGSNSSWCCMISNLIEG